MDEWFLVRGYPEIVVNNQRDKVVFSRDQSVKKNLKSGIPFVTTYHPKVKELEKLIRDLLLLYTVMEKFKRFSHPLRSYHSARKIKDCIVRSKFYHVERRFLQSHFLQVDHQGFFKDVEVRLIDKTQAPDGLNIESDYW